MSATVNKPFRITGWHVLAGMVAFFGIIIGLDLWFATLAYRSFSGEVASNPYEAGIAFNQTLAQRRHEAELGWQATVDDTQADALVLTWLDRDGAALDGLTITATLTRPATEAGAMVVAFVPQGQGRYRAATGVLDGAWDLSATAVNAVGDQFEIAHRLEKP